MSSERVLFPSLSLLFTVVAFGIVFASGFLGSSHLMNLFYGASPLPVWLRWYLFHSSLVQAVVRAGFIVSVLGSVLTLWLLHKTDTPGTAWNRLAAIGWTTLWATGLLFGLVLGGALFPLIPSLVKGNLPGQIKPVLSGLLLSVPIVAGLCFVFVASPFSLIVLLGRLKTAAPVRQPPHVLQ